MMMMMMMMSNTIRMPTRLGGVRLSAMSVSRSASAVSKAAATSAATSAASSSLMSSSSLSSSFSSGARARLRSPMSTRVWSTSTTCVALSPLLVTSLPRTSFSTSTSTTRASPRLFGVSPFSELADIQRLARTVRSKCDQLMRELDAAPPSLRVLHIMDDISDELCRTLDVADLLRNVHPDERWRNACEWLAAELGQYMEQLNQHMPMYEKLRAVNASAALVASFTPEQRRVAHVLQREMEQHGIGLPAVSKQRVFELQSEILQLTTTFTRTLNEPHDFIEVSPAAALLDMPAEFRQRIRAKPGSNGRVALMPADLDMVDAVLLWVDNEDVRRHAFIAGATANVSNIAVLDRLIAARHELATLLGYRSYADMHVSTLVAKTPARVREFLTSVLAEVKRRAVLELELIALTKQKDSPSRRSSLSSSSPLPSSAMTTAAKTPTFSSALLLAIHRLTTSLSSSRSTTTAATAAAAASTTTSTSLPVRAEAWDVPFYTGRLKADMYNLNSATLSSYFSLDNCLRGLHLVLSRVFNCSVERVPLAPEENWTHGMPGALADEVVKLRIYDHEHDEVAGIVYLDLFHRPTKFRGAAAFAVQSVKKTREGRRQLPVITIVAGHPRPASASSPILLTHGRVQTLFHEFGHACHHILCRNEFQHLSGARGELDFVELPSTLFENFVWDHRVLRHFATHHATGEPIPEQMVANLRRSRVLFYGLDTTIHASMSLYDQDVFGTQPLPCSTSELLRRNAEQYALVPHVDGTHRQCNNAHLCHYGAGYYTYLICTVYSTAVWNKLFARDPLSRKSGMHVRREMLEHGGARDPEQVLAALLDTVDFSYDAIRRFVQSEEAQERGTTDSSEAFDLEDVAESKQGPWSSESSVTAKL